MGAFIRLLKEAPKWTLAVAVWGFFILLAVTYFTGPVEFLWGKIGFSGRKTEPSAELIVARPADELDFRKKEFTYHLLSSFGGPDREAVEKIFKCFPQFREKPKDFRSNVISTVRANAIIHQPTFLAVRNLIVDYINSYDNIAGAYRYGMTDEPMFKAAFQHLIGLWYLRLHTFIELYKQDCDCSWDSFEKLGPAWLPKGADLNAQPSDEENSCVEDRKLLPE